MICTLAEWQKKEKDVGDFIVQASVVDGSDSWQPFPIGMREFLDEYILPEELV